MPNTVTPFFIEYFKVHSGAHLGFITLQWYQHFFSTLESGPASTAPFSAALAARHGLGAALDAKYISSRTTAGRGLPP
jgi:hypothetical protein